MNATRESSSHHQPNPYASGQHRHQTPPRRRSALRYLIKLVLIGFAALFVLALVTYSPGSSVLDEVVIRGRIFTEDGRPLINERVEILLPASYGLAPHEAKDPARYGSKAGRAQVTTDSDGRFSTSFGPWVYHVDFYYLPYPVRIPERAPALRFYLRIPRVSSEYYAIHAREGSYWAYSDEGVARSEAAAPIASLAIREELDGEPRVERVTGIVELTYESPEETR